MYEPPNEIEYLESFLNMFGNNQPSLECSECGSGNLMLLSFDLSFEGYDVNGEYRYKCRSCKIEKENKV